MTNPFDLPSVIKCPSCARTNGVPTRGGTFDCMFCGAKIVLPAAPTSSSFSTPAVMPSPQASPARTPQPTTPNSPNIQPPFQLPPMDRPAPPRPPVSAPLPPTSAIPQAGGAFTTGSAFDPGSNELIRYRWYSGKAVLELVMATLTAAFFTVVFFLTVLNGNSGQIPWLFVLFFVTFVFSSLASVYRGLAKALNTTSLQLESGVISARHRPIPWSGARLDVDTIERIGVDQQRVQQNRRSSTVRYNLVAVRKDGSKIVLIPGVNTQAEGETMAEGLNRRLGLGR